MYTVPDQSGRLAVVTGANSGTGKEAAARLAGAGASVVLAVRSPDRGEVARAEILDRIPGAELEVRRLDLADLSSIREFAGGLVAGGRPVDMLLNNAGVMAVPERRLTVDGFELQMASNALGPLALTVRLLPLLLAAPAPRVVTMSSLVARVGRVDAGASALPRRYHPWGAYAASKLADLLLTRHLARIADANGWPLRSTAAHPGVTLTNLASSGPSLGRRRTGPTFAERLVAWQPSRQNVAVGAEPLLFAAADPAALTGGYYGPSGRLELVGPVGPARLPRRARDADLAERFWLAAQELTDVQLMTSDR